MSEAERAHGENKNRERERQTEEGGKEEGERKDERERKGERERETKIEGSGRKREQEDILFLAAPLCTSQKPVSPSPRSTKETDNFRQGFLREEKYVYIYIYARITKTRAR